MPNYFTKFMKKAHFTLLSPPQQALPENEAILIVGRPVERLGKVLGKNTRIVGFCRAKISLCALFFLPLRAQNEL
jgi:hypothetical protein